MGNQQNHKSLKGRSLIALLLIFLISGLLLPIIGNADGTGGEVPIPDPPYTIIYPDTLPDTTGGDD